MRDTMPNHPAAGKAGLTSRLTTEHHWPGLPDPGRWVSAAVLHI
jgi:hypothetical protein